jgi:natural product biosynthesis luciferase-like monooxygenase protein/thioester reductase-like protein
MKFGLIFFASQEPERGDRYGLVLDSARFADTHGFSSIWIPERHFTPEGSLFPNPAVIQAALARETRRVALRAGSVVAPLHDPLRIAEEWAVVDNLSEGRVGLSFASGWHPNDFVLAPSAYAERHEVMARSIAAVRRLWTGDTVTLPNGAGQPTTVRIYPTPVQKELPIWVTAAGNPVTFEKAGALGANLLTHLFSQSQDELAERIALYRAALAANGHDPASRQVTLMLHTFVDDDFARAAPGVLRAFRAYLKSASHLLQGIGLSRGRSLDVASLSGADLDDYVEFVADRLVSDGRVLFGTPEGCHRLVEKLSRLDVDELACQIDFGLGKDDALRGLTGLDDLRRRCESLGAAPPLRAFRSTVARAPATPAPRPNTLDEIRARLVRVSSALFRGPDEALAGLPFDAEPGISATLVRELLTTLTGTAGAGITYQVTRIGRARVAAGAGAVRWTHARVRERTKQGLRATLRALDEYGAPAIELDDVEVEALDADSGDVTPARGADLYEVAFAAAPPDPPPSARGSWIVLGRGGSIGQELSRHLRIRGHGVVEIARDTGAAAIADAARAEPSCRGIVDLRGLHRPRNGEGVYEELVDASFAIASLVGELARRSSTHTPKLWLVTRSAQSVRGFPAASDPSGAALWGAGRAVEIEQPNVFGGLVDIDGSDTDARNAEALCRCLEGPAGRQSAVRQGARHEARLVRVTVKETAPPFAAAADATIVVTGGASGVGLEIAEWLAARGARHLLLLSRRRAPNPQRLARLRESGAIVRASLCDVANLSDLGGALRQIEGEGWPAVRGVVHAAGVVADQRLDAALRTSFEEVLRPKVAGLEALRRTFEDRPLDVLVLVSSLSSLVPVPGEAAYACANAFLDGVSGSGAFPAARIVSVNWGPWKNVGYGEGVEGARAHARLEEQGIVPLERRVAVERLGQVLSTGRPQTAVAAIDWTRYGTFVGSAPPVLLGPILAAEGSAQKEESTRARRSLDALAPPARQEWVESYLAERAARVMRRPKEELDRQRSLYEAGLDSLMAIELKRRIEVELQTGVPVTKLLKGPSVAELASTLLEQLYGDPPAPGGSRPARADLRAEVTLEPAIRGDSRSEVSSREIEAPLLTGATGFLGAFLLRELLDHTQGQVRCLVRASSDAEATSRIVRNLSSFGLWNEDHRGRVIPVLGDLARPLFGLTGHSFDELAASTRAIFHNGAVVNFSYPYEAVRAANVEGTREILRLATGGHLKTVHYVSTVAVFQGVGRQVVDEAVVPDRTEGLALGYNQSKWVAENTVALARDRGIPIAVYRPSTIFGESALGLFNSDDFVVKMIQGCVQLGAAPDIDVEINLVPVDYVSRAIVWLARAPSSDPAHLINRQGVRWRWLLEWMARYGYPLRRLPYRQWVDLLHESAERTNNALLPLLGLFTSHPSSQWLELPAFEDGRTRGRLEASGIVCPPIDDRLLDVYFRRFATSGIVPYVGRDLRRA